MTTRTDDPPLYEVGQHFYKCVSYDALETIRVIKYTVEEVDDTFGLVDLVSEDRTDWLPVGRLSIPALNNLWPTPHDAVQYMLLTQQRYLDTAKAEVERVERGVAKLQALLDTL